jgi:hypothetical protein
VIIAMRNSPIMHAGDAVSHTDAMLHWPFSYSSETTAKAIKDLKEGCCLSSRIRTLNRQLYFTIHVRLPTLDGLFQCCLKTQLRILTDVSRRIWIE